VTAIRGTPLETRADDQPGIAVISPAGDLEPMLVRGETLGVSYKQSCERFRLSLATATPAEQAEFEQTARRAEMLGTIYGRVQARFRQFLDATRRGESAEAEAAKAEHDALCDAYMLTMAAPLVGLG
jgi:hypothetical protein